ncbi:MAG: hypothetical protein IJ863_01515 [Spirochaetales bacterium]|nr:hypothetical protein [Spirochaetales bacterium]
MRYVSQLDYPDYPYPTRTDSPEDRFGHVSTVSTSGCGLCCAVMMADRLIPDCTFDIPDAVELAVGSGANHGPGTDMVVMYKPLCERLGLKGQVSNDVESVSMCLRTGGCVIANVSVRDGYDAVFTKGAHYIVVLSETGDGRFSILDPSMFRKGKMDAALAAGKVEIKGKIVICSRQVLDDDATGMFPHKYFLFWRA